MDKYFFLTVTLRLAVGNIRAPIGCVGDSVAGGKSTEAWCSVLCPARDLGVPVLYHRCRHLNPYPANV